MSFEYWADPARPAWAGCCPAGRRLTSSPREKASTRSCTQSTFSRRSTDPSRCRAGALMGWQALSVAEDGLPGRTGADWSCDI
jgi:hypothetical protein